MNHQHLHRCAHDTKHHAWFCTATARHLAEHLHKALHGSTAAAKSLHPPAKLRIIILAAVACFTILFVGMIEPILNCL
jgi:hypothetical protein